MRCWALKLSSKANLPSEWPIPHSRAHLALGLIKKPEFSSTKDLISVYSELDLMLDFFCSIWLIKDFYGLKSSLFTTHLLEWLKCKTLTTPKAGRDAEQQELSFVAGGNAK